MLRKAGNLRTVQELGGGKSLKVVERYAHLSPEHLCAAAELLAVPSADAHLHPDYTRTARDGGDVS